MNQTGTLRVLDIAEGVAGSFCAKLMGDLGYDVVKVEPPTGNVWTVKSEAQNRPLVRSVTYDPQSGAELSRSGFADKHPIDRAINIGIAWHEGALFGLTNQIMGLVIALALIALSVLGVLMWLKRRPKGKLAAPPPGGRLPRGLIAGIVVLALLLPLFGVSLVAILLFDKARGAFARR